MSEMNLTYVLKVMGVLDETSVGALNKNLTNEINKLQGSLPPIKLRVALDEGSVADLRNRLGGSGPLGGGAGRASSAVKPGEGPAAAIEQALRHAAESAGGSGGARGGLSPFDRDKQYALRHGLDEGRAAEYAEAKKVLNLRKMNDTIEQASKRLGVFAESLQMIQRGALRAGISKMVSGLFAENSVAGAFVGAFSGVVASSIAFPIAWAIGDAIMGIGAQLEHRVVTDRYLRSLPAQAGEGSPHGPQWTRGATQLRNFFARLNTPEGEPLRDMMTGLLRTYQSAGVAQGTAEEAKSGVRAGYVAGLLAMAGLEKKPAEIMHDLKLIEFGDLSQQKEAMRHIAGKEYLKPMLLEEIMKKQGLSGFRGKILAENLLNEYLQLTPGAPGAYKADEIAHRLEVRAREESRVKGELAKQRQEYRWFGEEGFAGTVFGTDAKLSDTEKKFVDLMEESYRAEKKGETKNTLWGWGTARKFEDHAARRRYIERLASNWPRIGSPERMSELKKLARARTGDLEGVVGEGMGKDNFTSPSFLPSKFSFTSFAGLAENMQQMWGALPNDVTVQNTGAVEKLTSAVQEQTAILADMNYGGTVGPFYQGDVMVPEGAIA